jgi:hypothetical protein
VRGSWWLLMCALWCAPASAKADGQSAKKASVEAGPATPDEAHPRPPIHVEQSLVQAKLALERAHFSEADHLLSEVFAEPALSAQLRNDALELLAIVQIAARRESQAKDTLRLLLRRDPEHPRRVSDPGPAVDAAFAHARQVAVDVVNVPLGYELRRDESARLSLSVELRSEQAEARDAVQGVHVFVRDAQGAPLVHLVSEIERDNQLGFLLPEADAGARELLLHVEAHAPSGVVIGQAGEADAPLHLALPARVEVVKTCPAPPTKPLRREWWLWTSVGLVISGFAVASALTLH